jgi:hypothetical protein
VRASTGSGLEERNINFKVDYLNPILIYKNAI